MNFKIRGENMSVTQHLREYAEKKILKLEKYFNDQLPSEVFVKLKVQKQERIVEVTIPYFSFVVRAEETHTDMYAAIDLVVEKLVRQIQKYKTKVNKLKREKRVVATDPIVESSLVTSDDQFQVVRQKRINVKPMDVEEAVLQMDMLGHSFFVFLDHKGGKSNVVYKRKDGKYGLIIPE